MFNIFSEKLTSKKGKTPLLNRRLLVLFGAAACLSIFSSARAEAVNYFVSPSGNNTSGTTLKTAWSELDQINWSVIKPGDRIFLDGGTSGITYRTTLTIPASATYVNFDTVEADQPGHSGPVTFDGTNSQTGVGIQFLGTATGVGLSGSTITNWYMSNFQTAAIEAPTTCVAQIGMTTFQNNHVGVLFTGSPALNAGFSNEFQIVFSTFSDNDMSIDGVGAPCLWADWFTNSTYPDPNQPKSGATLSSGNVYRCIFGPGLYDGLISASTGQSGYISVDNSLFIDATHANINVPQAAQNQIGLFACTSFMTPLNPAALTHYCLFDASPSAVIQASDSVFYGGAVSTPGVWTSGTTTNLQYALTGNTLCFNNQSTNPNFVTNVGALPNDVSIATLTNTDYSISSQYSGNYGSSVTSVASLNLHYNPNNLGSSGPTKTHTPTPEPVGKIGKITKAGLTGHDYAKPNLSSHVSHAYPRIIKSYPVKSHAVFHQKVSKPASKHAKSVLRDGHPT
jgi:hypothetical protein